MHERLHDAGLLLLRVSIAGFMVGGHGLSKLLSFSEKMHTFPDPMGVGSPVSLTLAVLGEVVAPLLMLFGFFTRIAALPAAITMGVAAFVVHADDPFATREKALLYGVCFLAIALLGPGRISLDHRYRGRS